MGQLLATQQRFNRIKVQSNGSAPGHIYGTYGAQFLGLFANQLPFRTPTSRGTVWPPGQGPSGLPEILSSLPGSPASVPEGVVPGAREMAVVQLGTVQGLSV